MNKFIFTVLFTIWTLISTRSYADEYMFYTYHKVTYQHSPDKKDKNKTVLKSGALSLGLTSENLFVDGVNYQVIEDYKVQPYAKDTTLHLYITTVEEITSEMRITPKKALMVVFKEGELKSLSLYDALTDIVIIYSDLVKK